MLECRLWDDLRVDVNANARFPGYRFPAVIIGHGLYGVLKVWHHLRREGLEVSRCRVARLMKDAGLAGVRRGKVFRTTRADANATRPPGLVDRVFTAFVSDVFSRRIVGWRTAASMPTQLPLDALEMALWTRARAGQDVDGVVHHSDAGCQGGPLRLSTTNHQACWLSNSSHGVCSTLKLDERWNNELTTTLAGSNLVPRSLQLSVDFLRTHDVYSHPVGGPSYAWRNASDYHNPVPRLTAS